MVYNHKIDAVDAAYAMVAAQVARIAFVSITPWGAFEVSKHSVSLNAPYMRFKVLRAVMPLSVETIYVDNWRRN